MGGSASSERKTRDITIEETPDGAIEITNSAAKRILGLEESESREQKFVSEDEKDAEIQRMQSYYKQRISDMDRKNSELYQTSVDEFERAVNEVENKFFAQTCSVVCANEQQELLRCYQDNPKQTLNCSDLAKNFMQCVRKQREAVLLSTDRKGA